MNAARVSELGEVPADAHLPTEHGNFRIRVFHEEETGLDHVALLLGDMGGSRPRASESTLRMPNRRCLREP